MVEGRRVQRHEAAHSERLNGTEAMAAGGYKYLLKEECTQADVCDSGRACSEYQHRLLRGHQGLTGEH